MHVMRKGLFQLDRKGATTRVEVVAGATTFLTMAYIIFVNPNILAEAGMNKEGLVAATCLVTAAATMVTGLFANAPIAMAPGMGLNAFFAYSLVLGDGVKWETALGVVFLSGLFFLILTLVGLRKKLVEAIPASLISAIAVGIGLFITFIGLQKLGAVVNNDVTLVSAGPLTAKVLIGLAGLAVMVFMESRKMKGALLVGILFSTALAWACGYVERPARFISMQVNLSSVALRLDILGALKWSLFGSIFSLMFMDMFDSIGTLAACCYQARMVDEEGKIRGLDRLLGIDAAATMLGAVFGTSTTTSYIESAAGIEQGGRTGLTSVVTGALFILALLFVPVVGIVPEYATAPALIMVGLFMMKEMKRINFGQLDEAFPAFIIMVMIALSYSISTGLAFGFVSFALIKSVSGKVREVKPVMWLIVALSLAFLTQGWISNMIGSLTRMGAAGAISEQFEGGAKMGIKVTSAAFGDGGMIPSKYTCDGNDISPPLAWEGIPEGTKSIALIADDPDAPMGTWVHWVVYNLPPETKELPEKMPLSEELDNGAKQGMMSFKRVGYGGPCPPSGTHRYFFKVYALDTVIEASGTLDKSKLLKAMEGHILAHGQIMGRYRRK